MDVEGLFQTVFCVEDSLYSSKSIESDPIDLGTLTTKTDHHNLE